MSNAYAGPPIILRDPDKDTDKTAPQLLAAPAFDSRLVKNTKLTYKRIREIRRDPTVCLARQTVLAPMIHTPWIYKERDTAPSGAVDFIRNCFEPLRDRLLQQSVLNTLDYGWAGFEVVYMPVDGEIKLSKFKNLIPDYTNVLVYIDTGDFAGYESWPLTMGADFDRFQVLLDDVYCQHIVLEVEGTDWYGHSIYECLDNIQQSWDTVEDTANRYDAKIAGALWVIHFPLGKTDYNGEKDVDNALIADDVLKKIVASGGVAIPNDIQEFMDEENTDPKTRSQWWIELITTSGSSSQNNFIDRQKYLDNLKVRAFGIPERTLLEARFGTKAEAETHSDIALSTIDTRHRLICDQYNEQSVRHLLRLNYGKEYEESVYIEPAPLVDAQFQMIKEFYRLILQHPNVGPKEISNLNIRALREELNVPETTGADESIEYEEPQANPFKKGFDDPESQGDKGGQRNGEEE